MRAFSAKAMIPLVIASVPILGWLVSREPIVDLVFAKSVWLAFAISLYLLVSRWRAAGRSVAIAASLIAAASFALIEFANRTEMRILDEAVNASSCDSLRSTLENRTGLARTWKEHGPEQVVGTPISRFESIQLWVRHVKGSYYIQGDPFLGNYIYLGRKCNASQT